MATRVEKTVGPVGRDYPTLAAFVAGEARNLVTADEIAVARCDSFVDVAPVDWAGFTCDATRYISVESVAVWDGIWDITTPSSYVLSAARNSTYLMQVNSLHRVNVVGIQIRNTGAGAGTCDFQVIGTGFSRLRLDRVGSLGNGNAVRSVSNSGNIQIIRSALNGGLECLVQTNSNALKAYSTLLISRNAGVNTLLTQNTSVFKNCYMRSNGGVAIPAGTWGTQVTCATSDASSATPALRNIAYDNTNFVNAAAHTNLHLTAGSALKNVGTDTSGDPDPYDFETDIDGNLFGSAGGAWDIGFHEQGGIPPGPGIVSPNDVTHLLRMFFDPTNNKLHVWPVSAASTGSLLSKRQIFHDCYYQALGVLRVVDVVAAPNATIEKLSYEQILQKIHDPGARALRIIKGVAGGGSSPLISKEQVMEACYDPTNVALRVSPVGAGGAAGGSLLSETQILRACYDPGVGLRMNV